VALLRRSTPSTDVSAVFAGDSAEPLDRRALRDETDPDPLVEEAVERLRAALVALDARDEWGRTLAWRQVARIAIGPLLTQLRDSQTATTLLDATRPADDSAIPTQMPRPVGSGWPDETLFWAD
jgi:hypothetical protein